jgi:hypothetical protein
MRHLIMTALVAAAVAAGALVGTALTGSTVGELVTAGVTGATAVVAYFPPRSPLQILMRSARI